MDRSVDIFQELGPVNWDDVFAKQSQMGAGRFVGRGYQRGRGFGQFLHTLRYIIPAVLSSPVGQELVNLTRGIVEDVKSGQRLTRSFRRRARQSVRNLVGVGKRRKAVKKRKTTRKRRVTVKAKRYQRKTVKPLAISRSRAVVERSPLFIRAGKL